MALLVFVLTNLVVAAILRTGHGAGGGFCGECRAPCYCEVAAAAGGSMMTERVTVAVLPQVPVAT